MSGKFKTERELLDSGWRWRGDDILVTNDIRDNEIPRIMLEELSGTCVTVGIKGFWTVTPAMVLSESEEVELILKQYDTLDSQIQTR
jgi:hypothetical protein